MDGNGIDYVSPDLCRLLDEGMAYRACRPGLAGDIPDTSRPAEWGYLWNPRANVLIDCVDNDDGGCDVVAYRGFDPDELARRAHEAGMPWAELVPDRARRADGLPGGLAPAMAGMPQTGWLRAYPGVGGLEGSGGLARALYEAQMTEIRHEAEHAAPGQAPATGREEGSASMDAAHEEWLKTCLREWGADNFRSANDFVRWALSSPDAPLPPGGFDILEAQGSYVPFTLDAQSVPAFLDYAGDLDDGQVARAVERATGHGLDALLGAWAEAVGDLTDGVNKVPVEAGSVRARALDDALAGMGATRQAFLEACEDVTRRDAGLFEPRLADAAEAMGFAGLSDNQVAAAVKRACGKDPERLLRAWAEEGPGTDGLAAALERVGSSGVELRAELNLANLRGDVPDSRVGEPFTVLERQDGAALLKSPYPNDPTPFVVAWGYDSMTGEWASGKYFGDLLDALADLRDAAYIDAKDPDNVCCVVWTRDDIEQELSERAGRPATEAEVDEAVSRMGDDLEDVACARAWDFISPAIDEILDGVAARGESPTPLSEIAASRAAAPAAPRGMSL